MPGAWAMAPFGIMRARIRPGNKEGPEVFKYLYPRIWPIAFLAFGLIAASGGHLHYEVADLQITSHNLMWFCMALAHADVFWRGRNGAARHAHH